MVLAYYFDIIGAILTIGSIFLLTLVHLSGSAFYVSIPQLFASAYTSSHHSDIPIEGK